MNPVILAYLGIGLLFAVRDHRDLEVDWEALTPKQTRCVVVQQVVHYFRMMATWPTYVIEDWMIAIGNGEEEEE